MSKCERGEIWTGRFQPDEDLFELRLPETYEFLKNNFTSPKKRLKFFACSSFGVLGDSQYDFDPRPNRNFGDYEADADIEGFIKNPDSWNPFGLISPLYWLSTGKELYDRSL